MLVAAPASATPAPARPADRVANQGSLGLQLLTVPVSERKDPLARLYIVDHLHPGTATHRLIEVSNTTASTMPVVLYPAAAMISDGSFVGAAGHTRDAVSTWTSVTPSVADIRAGGHLTAMVTIMVPRSASPGVQYGVVWAETRMASRTGVAITEVSRVGIRIYLSVGRGGSPPSRFTIASVTAARTSHGQPMVVASVHNTGGRPLDLYGTLRLTSGPGGLTAGPFPANLGVTLGIGDTEPVRIVLDKRLPAGPWRARITLHSGLTGNSAEATITFPAPAATPFPYLIVLGLTIALLGSITVLAVIKRRWTLALATRNSRAEQSAM